MAKRNDFTKRAEDLLAARRDSAQRLGDLLETKSEQLAAIATTDTKIEAAVTECIQAGWKPAELLEIGAPKSAMPRRQTRTARLEHRTITPTGTGAPTEERNE